MTIIITLVPQSSLLCSLSENTSLINHSSPLAYPATSTVPLIPSTVVPPHALPLISHPTATLPPRLSTPDSVEPQGGHPGSPTSPYVLESYSVAHIPQQLSVSPHGNDIRNQVALVLGNSSDKLSHISESTINSASLPQTFATSSDMAVISSDIDGGTTACSQNESPNSCQSEVEEDLLYLPSVAESDSFAPSSDTEFGSEESSQDYSNSEIVFDDSDEGDSGSQTGRSTSDICNNVLLAVDDGHTSSSSACIAQFLALQMAQFCGCDPESHGSSEATPMTSETAQTTSSTAHMQPSCRSPIQSYSMCASNDIIPEVVSKEGFLPANAYQLNTVDANLIYSGIYHVGEDKYEESLSFDTDQQYYREKIKPIQTFDNDSVLAIPSSLAVARIRIKLSFTPARHHNIQADLHIRIPVPGRHNLQTKLIAISQIPHIQLGYICGAEDYKVFLLFPYLQSCERKTNFLHDRELERFTDQILLPAIQQHCPASILHHLPSSFDMAKLSSLAAGREPVMRQTSTTGRSQTLFYVISNQYLASIWQSIRINSRSAGLRDLQDPIIFINAKNLKLATMSADISTTVESFQSHLDYILDQRFLPEDSIWLDIATEVTHDWRNHQREERRRDGGVEGCYEPSGLEVEEYIFSWRNCCLKRFRERFQEQFPNEGFQFAVFNWGLTNDLANQSLIPGMRHSARLGGLVYSQFYGTVKEIFDAGKVYPFQNEGLEALAVDIRLQETWQQISGHGNRNI
ncbi:hypothetical protein HOY80DRAFT_1083951 [Tuber brumale]|nr:hypothetical protein HOY80DRAFT_1083951 [Tuber brumale]